MKNKRLLNQRKMRIVPQQRNMNFIPLQQRLIGHTRNIASSMNKRRKRNHTELINDTNTFLNSPLENIKSNITRNNL